MRLGSMRLAAASRAAVPGLQDAAPIVRATTAKAILLLGSEESAGHLLPLLTDKDEFVRRETAYALGLTRSRSATTALSERLLNDKEDGVRGAAAIALGQIADEAAVPNSVHSWTPTPKLAKDLAPVLRMGAGRLAWDIYMLYAPGVVWDREPPAPITATL